MTHEQTYRLGYVMVLFFLLFLLLFFYQNCGPVDFSKEENKDNIVSEIIDETIPDDVATDDSISDDTTINESKRIGECSYSDYVLEALVLSYILPEEERLKLAFPDYFCESGELVAWPELSDIGPHVVGKYERPLTRLGKFTWYCEDTRCEHESCYSPYLEGMYPLSASHFGVVSHDSYCQR